MWSYLLALLLVFVRPALGDPCVLTMGSQYQLKSDTVDWTMQTSSGQSCIRGLRHKRVTIDTAKLISPPQSGQVKLLGSGFSYTAKSDFEGQDSFTIQVSGMLNGIRGSSDIRIIVSVGPRSGSGPWNWSCNGSNGGANASCSAPVSTPPVGTLPYSQITLVGNKIYDIAGQQIIARGPELVSGGDLASGMIDSIAATGANALRLLVLLDAENGRTPATIDSVLAEAKSKRMLVWLSLITFTGNIGSAFGGGSFYSLPAPAGIPPCSQAQPTSCFAAMWERQWLKDLAAKYKTNLIIDAMQEFSPTSSTELQQALEWSNAAKSFIPFFRSQGYTNPLQFMSNTGGRDLFAIHTYGAQIAAVDSVVINGTPQTMFGWQAYWGTSDNWYPASQGNLFGVGNLPGAQAITQFAATEPFAIEIGIDNFGGDTNLTYQDEINAAATAGMSWLWWNWNNPSGVNCPVSGTTCQSFVTAAPNGFGGAVLLSAP